MTNRQIIENALIFLREYYGFSYNYECVNNGATYFWYYNEYGCFTYYQWEQFQEEEFSVKYNGSHRIIDFSILNPKEICAFYKTHKGIKWLFKDKRKEYWHMIAQLIKNEIQKTGTLFGIKIK